MMTDDDGRIAKLLAEGINREIDDGKSVSIWLASGKVIEGVRKVTASDVLMTIEHSAMSWRIRTDHIVGYSAK